MSVGSRSASIDGLRGIAIVLVLLHHFNIAYEMNDTVLAGLLGWRAIHAVFRNGNYAVTVFFVISGFLITSNAERRWGSLASIHPLAFYRYRAARIMPCVLLLLLIVNLLAALGLGIFENHSQFGKSVSFWVVDLASLTFWMNVLMSRAGWLNYVLCVQWSLSVEEVFYLSFPILCLVLRRDRWLVLTWGIFIVVGPIWRHMHHMSEYEELNGYLSCFDGIAFGCCAAILSKHCRWSGGLSMAIQILMGAAMVAFYLWRSISDTAVYGVTLMSLCTALLLIAQANGGDSQSSAAWAPLRFCGRLSYELYLFHLILLAALRCVWPPGDTVGNGKMLLLGAYVGGSVILAELVGRYYSDPLNRWLRTGQWTPALLPGCAPHGVEAGKP